MLTLSQVLQKKQHIHRARNEIDRVSEEWFPIAKTAAKSVDVDSGLINIPCTCGRQQNRDEIGKQSGKTMLMMFSPKDHRMLMLQQMSYSFQILVSMAATAPYHSRYVN